MEAYVLPYPVILDQIEYLEKKLQLLKKVVSTMVFTKTKKPSLYGSLPKTNLKFEDFKALRKTLSKDWEKEWNL